MALRTVTTKLIWNESFKFYFSYPWIVQRHQSSYDQMQEVGFVIDSTWHIRNKHPRNVSDSGLEETNFNCFHSVKWPLTTNRAALHMCAHAHTHIHTMRQRKGLCFARFSLSACSGQSQTTLLTYVSFFLSVLLQNGFLINSNFYKIGNNHTNPTSSGQFIVSLLFHICQIKNIWYLHVSITECYYHQRWHI